MIWKTVAVVAVVGAAGGALLLWRPWLDPAQFVESVRPERPALSVRAVAAERSSIQAWVFAEGTARSVRREYLTFENPGRITYVAPGPDGTELREGDTVAAGVVLARQDQRSYEAAIQTATASLREAGTQKDVAEADVVQAQADELLAEATFRRFEALLAKNSASQQEHDEARASAAKSTAAVAQARSRVVAAQAQIEAAEARVAQERVKLEQTEIRSPIDGVVAYLNIEQGLYFAPSSIRTGDETAALQSIPLVIIDPTEFEVIVKVPAYERQRIAPGQSALLVTGAQSAEAMARGEGEIKETRAPEPGSSTARLPDTPIRGEVFSVNPAISPGGRSVQVRLRTTLNGHLLEDGEFVTVWIATERRDDVVVAPMGAFTYRNNGPFVYVLEPGSGVAQLRSVELGLQGFGIQQVTGGVEGGDLLVTEGRFQISDGARVRLLGAAPGEMPASQDKTGGRDE